MDISPDFPLEVDVTECPLCTKKYILEIVLNTHLLAHLNYYQGYGQKQFACTLCPFENDDINLMCAHLKSTHAQKTSIDQNGANRILARNIREKNQMILKLSQSNDNEPGNPLLPLKVPYYYP